MNDNNISNENSDVKLEQGTSETFDMKELCDTYLSINQLAERTEKEKAEVARLIELLQKTQRVEGETE